jgi:ATP-dependent helicase/nuclease subunit A
LPAWSPNKKSDCAEVAAARAARRDDGAKEYRRLLYVAMTRAEERLYIAGHRGQRAVAPESWRIMIETSLKLRCSEAPAPWGGDDFILRFGADSPEEAREIAAQAEAKPSFVIPPWLLAPAQAESSVPPPLRPSSALDGAESTAPDSPGNARRARALEEGRQLHRLFEFLPSIAPDRRWEAALADLAAQGTEPERAAELVARVLRVLDDPRLAPLFGAASIAEARIAAKLERPRGGFLEIAGAIDRLAETPDGIWIADYKTGTAGNSLAEKHVAQLSLYRAAVALLYPGRPIRCFLIYTSGAEIVEISTDKLDAALEQALRQS